jgi:hypothetical protein
MSLIVPDLSESVNCDKYVIMHDKRQIILETLLFALDESSRAGNPQRFATGQPEPTDIPFPIDPRNVKDPVYRRRMGWKSSGESPSPAEKMWKSSKQKTIRWSRTPILLWPSDKLYSFLGIGGTNVPKKMGPGFIHKKGKAIQAFTHGTMSEDAKQPRSVEEIRADIDREYDTRGRASDALSRELEDALIARGDLPQKKKIKKNAPRRR